MTTPITDPLMPYEIQLTHTGQTTTSMAVIEGQRQTGTTTSHRLKPGVYMVYFTYNGAQSAELGHHSPTTGRLNRVILPTGAAGVPRSSAPMKISVETTGEFLNVNAAAATGGTARATISVIPFETYKPA